MTRLSERCAGTGIGFGTSGARGPAGGFTPGLCQAFVRSFLGLFAARPEGLLVGHDLRASSPGIAAAVIAAARSEGVAPVFAGTLPTPALALAAMARGLPAIMVTGSHIPPDRNGLKFFRPVGEIGKADEVAMLAADVGALRTSSPAALPPADGTPLTLYRQRYRAAFSPGALAGLRIGVFEHSGVARDLLHDVLQALGAVTVPLGRAAGFVAIDTEDIGPDLCAAAERWAGLHGLAAIVSTDGDADRPLLADEVGRWLRGDVLGQLCAEALGARTVVTPLTSSTAAERSGNFLQVVRTRIGSPHVIAAMAAVVPEQGPVVGYEANGGVLMGSGVKIDGRHLSALPTRDALLPLLAVLATVRAGGLPVSALACRLPRRFTSSGRLPGVPAHDARALIAALGGDAAALSPQSGPVLTVNRDDGLRAHFANGDILHVRASGNAPDLRCYTEAGTPDAAHRLCAASLASLAARLQFPLPA